jgi:hypothetical protein
MITWIKRLFPFSVARRAVKIDIRIVMDDAEGILEITDIMLQGGKIGTGWLGHTSELKLSSDE